MTQQRPTSLTIDALEGAIPAHLKRERTCPLSGPQDFIPKHASYSARFSEDVTALPMTYVGLQFPPGTEVGPAVQVIENGIAGPLGPEFSDRARFVDKNGFENLLFALYWRGEENFRRWMISVGDDWWHSGLAVSGPIGAFHESFQPSVMDTETTFSHRHPEGYTVLADKMSGKTDTHEYWGSARDRIPRAQFDELIPSKAVAPTQIAEETRGRKIVVQPAENLCLLRSGQDWSETSNEERAFYLQEVKPFLEIGMEELTEKGAALGCYFNRYVQLEGSNGQLEKTYSLSAWRSLTDLEAWVKAATHLQIFGAGIRHYKQAGDKAKLRLYHELMVLKADNQSFEYFNCHRDTGMLRYATL